MALNADVAQMLSAAGQLKNIQTEVLTALGRYQTMNVNLHGTGFDGDASLASLNSVEQIRAYGHRSVRGRDDHPHDAARCPAVPGNQRAEPRHPGQHHEHLVHIVSVTTLSRTCHGFDEEYDHAMMADHVVGASAVNRAHERSASAGDERGRPRRHDLDAARFGCRPGVLPRDRPSVSGGVPHH